MAVPTDAPQREEDIVGVEFRFSVQRWPAKRTDLTQPACIRVTLRRAD